MADKIILADTSILIDYFRKSDKSNSKLFALNELDHIICISVITEYEIYSGAPEPQVAYWRNFLKDVMVLDFDSTMADEAVKITKSLKRQRKLIDIPDLFIAATALASNLPIATLNKKHFDRIEGLILVE